MKLKISWTSTSSTKGPLVVPEMTGSPRRTAAEILAMWPSATVIVDNNGGPELYIVLKEWKDSLLDEPSAPTEDELADYDDP